MLKRFDQCFIQAFRRSIGLRVSGCGHALLDPELAEEFRPKVTGEQLVTVAGDGFRKTKRAAPVEVESLSDLLRGISRMDGHEANVARESISDREDRIISFALGNRTDQIDRYLDETSSGDRHRISKSSRGMG